MVKSTHPPPTVLNVSKARQVEKQHTGLPSSTRENDPTGRAADTLQGRFNSASQIAALNEASYLTLAKRERIIIATAV